MSTASVAMKNRMDRNYKQPTVREYTYSRKTELKH